MPLPFRIENVRAYSFAYSVLLRTLLKKIWKGVGVVVNDTIILGEGGRIY
jgi:hypothetical protein